MDWGRRAVVMDWGAADVPPPDHLPTIAVVEEQAFRPYTGHGRWLPDVLYADSIIGASRVEAITHELDHHALHTVPDAVDVVHSSGFGCGRSIFGS
jgi:hypothetical protein